MATFKTSEPRMLVERISRSGIARVYSSSSPVSVCALRMFTLIFERMAIKYEATVLMNYSDPVSCDYKLMIDLPKLSHGVHVGGVERPDADLLSGDVVGECNPTILAYEVARSLNAVDCSILWPLVVVLDFDRYAHSLTSSPSDENVASDHADLYREVVLHVRNTSGDITYVREATLPFKGVLSLSRCLSSDVKFICHGTGIFKQKLSTRISEFFLDAGVSRKEAGERFINIPEDAKGRLERRLQCGTHFSLSTGYNYSISTIESYFVLWHFILSLPAHAVTSLGGRVGIEKAAVMYSNVVRAVKRSSRRAKRVGHIRFIHVDHVGECNATAYLRLVLLVLDLIDRAMNRAAQKTIAIHPCEGRDANIIVSNSPWISKYMRNIPCHPTDTFGTGFSLNNESLGLLYKKIQKRRALKAA